MPRKRKPNLLLIWTDEQRPDTLACYGNEQVHAPHLNRLAAQSVVFDQAYCCQPVCTPSRGCILTGLWPHQHGAWTNNAPLRRDVPTIAELLDGHHSAYFGKWHLGDEIIAQHGFEHWVSIEDNYRGNYSDPAHLARFSDYHHFLVEQGYVPDQVAPDGTRVFSRSFVAGLAPRYTKAGFLGRTTADYIERYDDERPFCLSVNFLEPHMPFFGPLNDRHDPDALEVGPAFRQPPGEDAPLRTRMLADLYAQQGHAKRPLRSDWDWRRCRANYYGLVSLVDQAVGEILGALERRGLADDTIVVFTSDHGEMMGDHALLAKGVMYEESTRVPLLMRVPGLNARRVPGPVSQIDLLPTLLDLLDQPVDGLGLRGQSRRAAMAGEASLEDDVIVVWDGPAYRPKHVAGYSQEQMNSVAEQSWRTLISVDGWKLNLCSTDRCELYDLRNDPHEMRNLIDEPAPQERVRALVARMRRWQEAQADPLPCFDPPGAERLSTGAQDGRPAS